MVNDQQSQSTDHGSPISGHRSKITDNRSQATDHEPVNGTLFRNTACFRETSQQADKRSWLAVVEGGTWYGSPIGCKQFGKARDYPQEVSSHEGRDQEVRDHKGRAHYVRDQEVLAHEVRAVHVPSGCRLHHSPRDRSLTGSNSRSLEAVGSSLAVITTSAIRKNSKQLAANQLPRVCRCWT